MYKYSSEKARIYSQLGILGTTYEVSFNEMARLLGNLQGKTVLDFGTGTGRSAQLLQTLGAEKVIGVDHDQNMVNQAKDSTTHGIIFHLITDEKIPLPNESIDIAISAHVFVEMRSVENMQKAAKEIARVLKPGGTFMAIVTNPDAIGHEYVSYTYRKQERLCSGDPITCLIKGDKSFEIEDTYWAEQDYYQVLKDVGFEQLQVFYPLAEGNSWLEETKVAPDMIIEAIKPLRTTEVT